MIICEFCKKEHEQKDDIRCECGAHGFILKQDRKRSWFWSLPKLSQQNPVLDKETWLKYMSHE